MLKIVHAIERGERTNSVIIHRIPFKPIEKPTGSKPKILLVDDEKVILSTRKALLEDIYEVETAENISKAMEKLSSGKFDLLLTDWNLDVTNEDGLNLARDAKKAHPNLKIMLHTSLAYLVTDDQRFDNLDAIIDKNTHELSELISSVLHGDNVDKKIKLAHQVQRGELDVLRQVEDGRGLNISIIADDERIMTQINEAMDRLLDELHAMDITAFDLNKANEGDNVSAAVKNIQRVTMPKKTGDGELNLNPTEIVFVEDGLFSLLKNNIENLSKLKPPPMIVLVREYEPKKFTEDFTAIGLGNVDDTVLVLAEALVEKYGN